MTGRTIPAPQSANEFIEQQLDERLRAVEAVFKADAIGFTGPIDEGVDDLVRNTVEVIQAPAPRPGRLAVILTTYGGYIEVVKRVVETLRHHYRAVVFIVPNYAYSAGTVLAMSGDAIYMNYYSRLGPIDPQVEGASGRMVPALGYLVQWERLVEKAKLGELTAAEAQLMIQGFDQAQLYQYEQARELSIALLKEWLVQYKFQQWVETETRQLPVTEEMKKQRAEDIARALNDTDRWHTHGYGISMEVLVRDLNVKIDDFGSNANLDRAVKDYHNLLSDYMVKLGHVGAVHIPGRYTPF